MASMTYRGTLLMLN